MEQKEAGIGTILIKILLICACICVVAYAASMIAVLLIYPIFPHNGKLLSVYDVVAPTAVIASIFASIFAFGNIYTTFLLFNYPNRKAYKNIILVIGFLACFALVLACTISPFFIATSLL